MKCLTSSIMAISCVVSALVATMAPAQIFTTNLVPLAKERGKTGRTVVLTSVAVAGFVTALVRTAVATPAANILGVLLWLTSLCASAPQTFAQGGIPLWTNRYDGPVNGLDRAYAIAVDSSGNVFVTGWSAGSSSLNDYATIKYSSAGAALWTNSTDGLGNVTLAMGVDGGGNVFVTGASWNGNNSDYGTFAYSTAGVALWTNYCDGLYGNDFRAATAVDSSGDVFVAGALQGNSCYEDYVTIKYSSSLPQPLLLLPSPLFPSTKYFKTRVGIGRRKTPWTGDTTNQALAV